MQHFALVTVEPLEQVNSDFATVGEAAPKLLGAMHMGIDQAGNDELAGGIDHLSALNLAAMLSVLPTSTIRSPSMATAPSTKMRRSGSMRDDPSRVLDQECGH